jgi:hypothetical protein
VLLLLLLFMFLLCRWCLQLCAQLEVLTASTANKVCPCNETH